MPDLLRVGDDVVMDRGCFVSSAALDGGALNLRPIHVGNGAVLGANSVIPGGASIADGGWVRPVSTPAMQYSEEASSWRFDRANAAAGVRPTQQALRCLVGLP
eukprot:6321437-Prymnesium_polylepis.1